MQNRYVGDVGDFGKFALLRAITKGSIDIFRLGVVWCRFPDESHNGDGGHLGYLDRADFLSLEPNLHAALRELVKGSRRTLASIEAAGILPAETQFFSDSTSAVVTTNSVRHSRLAHRRSWRDGALLATQSADIVFFDPDNGIASASISEAHHKSGKYIFWEDLTPFWNRGQSLIVYHHLNRTMSAARQTEVLRAKFVERLGPVPLLAPLLFRRGSCRHFWIVGQPPHVARLEMLVRGFLSNGWERHFDPSWGEILPKLGGALDEGTTDEGIVALE
jgi:hypothetical protein